MLQKDKEKLRQLLCDYSPKEIIENLATSSLEVADNFSDNGLKEKAKELVVFSYALENNISFNT